MPFSVNRPSSTDDDSLRKLLNTMEVNEWTLVHIRQGYGDVEPAYIFHKPLSEREEALRDAGAPRFD